MIILFTFILWNIDRQFISYTLTLVAYSCGKWQGNYLTYSARILGRNYLVLSEHPFSAPRLRPCRIAPKSIRPIHLYHPFYHVYVYVYIYMYLPTKLGYVDTFWYYTQFVNCWLVDKLTSFLGSNMDFIGYPRLGFPLVVLQRILVEISLGLVGSKINSYNTVASWTLSSKLFIFFGYPPWN